MNAHLCVFLYWNSWLPLSFLMSSSWLFPLFYANNYCLIVGEIVPDIFLLAVIDVADSTFASVVRACIRLGFVSFVFAHQTCKPVASLWAMESRYSQVLTFSDWITRPNLPVCKWCNCMGRQQTCDRLEHNCDRQYSVYALCRTSKMRLNAFEIEQSLDLKTFHLGNHSL